MHYGRDSAESGAGMLTRPMNAVIEAGRNAEGRCRRPEQINLEFTRCQGCGHWVGSGDEWERSCDLFGREEWIELIIRPGESCGEFRALPSSVGYH